MSATIPRPHLVDGVPRCSAQCPAYRRGDVVNSPDTCTISLADWPRDRICLPGIQRMTEQIAKYRAHAFACNLYWAGVGNAVDQDEAMRRFKAMSEAAAAVKEADPQ